MRERHWWGNQKRRVSIPSGDGSKQGYPGDQFGWLIRSHNLSMYVELQLTAVVVTVVTYWTPSIGHFQSQTHEKNMLVLPTYCPEVVAPHPKIIESASSDFLDLWNRGSSNFTLVFIGNGLVGNGAVFHLKIHPATNNHQQ